MLFPGRKFSILVDPKQISVVFESEKQKEKKGVLTSFISFPTFISNFPPSLLQFSFFSPQFSPLSLFTLTLFSRYVSKNFPGQKSLTPLIVLHLLLMHNAICVHPLLTYTYALIVVFKYYSKHAAPYTV